MTDIVQQLGENDYPELTRLIGMFSLINEIPASMIVMQPTLKEIVSILERFQRLTEPPSDEMVTAVAEAIDKPHESPYYCNRAKAAISAYQRSLLGDYQPAPEPQPDPGGESS